MKKYITIIFLFFLTINCVCQNNLIFYQSNCSSPDSSLILKERIIEKHLINDSLKITFGIIDFCGANYKANYKIENDTLKLTLKSIEENTFCSCFYYLKFKIPGIKNISIPVILNNKEYKLTDQNLINFTDKVDTLENGNILISKYKDGIKVFEIEKTPLEKVYRQFRNGEMISEYIIINKKE